jgi:hypothetical protein
VPERIRRIKERKGKAREAEMSQFFVEKWV